jgi:glycosyltransferase involved in cell wall biosynthesis
MRVLQINAVNGYGSTGRSTTEMANYLNKNGHEGYIAYSAGTSFEKGYKIGHNIDYKLHGLCSRLFGTQAYFSKPSTRKLIDYIKNLKPNVVHLRNLHSNFINLKLLLQFLAQNDIPTVITLHDCWFYTGKCTHYTMDNCYRWQENCGSCPRLKKDNPSWFFDRTSKMLQDKKEWFSSIPRLAVVGVSDWITNEARKSFLSNAKIVTRIYNWIDSDLFKPVDTSLIKKKMGLIDKFVILGVASGWSNAKGLDKFIELSYELSDEYQIVLVGSISNNVKLSDSIIHVPETQSVGEIVEYYSMADVYLHLSMEETFGKTIAEAMACGTPAIVLDSTACPEVVGSDGGVVINKYSTDKVLQAIKTISIKPKNEYKVYVRNRVIENFNSQKLMAEHLSLYKKLINSHVV